MFNLISHQINAKQDQSESLFLNNYVGLKKKKKSLLTSAGKAAEQLKRSYTPGRNVIRYNCLGKYCVAAW